MGSLAAELRIVLEGRFAISRAELPLVQVVYKNHPSWENNPEARTALWPVLAQYLVLGRFEHVLEGDPLPIAILPVGAVPKSTFPWLRLILDCRYSNKFLAFTIFVFTDAVFAAQQKLFLRSGRLQSSIFTDSTRRLRSTAHLGLLSNAVFLSGKSG